MVIYIVPTGKELEIQEKEMNDSLIKMVENMDEQLYDDYYNDSVNTNKKNSNAFEPVVSNSSFYRHVHSDDERK